MSTPPPTDGMAPLVRLTRLRERYGALPRAKRELAIFGIALLFGLIAMPFLIWFAGNRVLGPYIHGQSPHAGPFALAADFLLGLLHGSAVLGRRYCCFWCACSSPCCARYRPPAILEPGALTSASTSRRPRPA